MRERITELAGALTAAIECDSGEAGLLFGRRVVNLDRLSSDLTQTANASIGGDIGKHLLRLRRNLVAVRQRLSDAESEAYSELQVLEDAAAGQLSDEDRRLRSNQRDLVRIRIAAYRRLGAPVSEITEFVDGGEGQLLNESSSILLLGDWGTGKTHFLCDFALQALDDDVPAVMVLASELRSDVHPLDAIAGTGRLRELRVVSFAVAICYHRGIEAVERAAAERTSILAS